MPDTLLQPGSDNPEDTIRNDVVRRLAHGQPAAMYRVCPDVFQQIALRLNETITKRQHPLHPDGPAIACLELYSNGQVALVFTGATSGSSASPSSDITVNELDNEERSQDEDDDLDDDSDDDLDADDFDADDLDDDDLDDNDLDDDDLDDDDLDDAHAPEVIYKATSEYSLVQLAWAMMLLMVVFAGAILVVSTIQTTTHKCPPQLEHR